LHLEFWPDKPAWFPLFANLGKPPQSVKWTR
jgi:hypothetical protein